MNLSDILQIISITATTLISLISLFIAIKALRLTRESIEESNRPNIVIYVEKVDTGYTQHYLVIKNFGNTGATIDSISCSTNFDKLPINRFLENMNNHYIAPNQSFVTLINLESEDVFAEFNLKYHAGKRNFSDTMVLNLNYSKGIYSVNRNKSDLSKEANLLRNVAHEFIKSKL